jgi:TATA-box binding protein (TBP) (component of TFIID and TFIIIB)
MVVICNIVLTRKLEGLNPQTMPRSDKRFNGAKIPLPGATCLLFRNGAITVVGVKSLKAIERIPHHLCCLFPSSSLVKPLKIVNMVATSNTNKQLDLKKVFQHAKKDHLITYTPETFPGMKIAVRQSLFAIVFHTGKVIITGAKTNEDLTYAESKIQEIIQQATVIPG